jgi:poly(A) polymerase
MVLGSGHYSSFDFLVVYSDSASDSTSLTPSPLVSHHPLDRARIDPDAVRVIRRLRRFGHQAYLVGGGVRDLLLGKTPKDFDIGTSASPDQVRSIFRNCRIIGRRFRLAHVYFSGGKIIEVATFRRDPSSEDPDITESLFQDEAGDDLGPEDGSAGLSANDPPVDRLIRNDNVFGEPHEDALRRDFTINGLFFDIDDQRVIDYVDGLRDVHSRVLRTIGRADVRFQEDPVRMLRAIKFSARLDLGLHPELYDAMVQQRALLRQSAKARVFEEVLRLLRGGASQRSLYMAWEMGLLGEVMPELSQFFDDSSERVQDARRLLWHLDHYVRSERLPSDAVLLTALFWGPLSDAIGARRWTTPLFESWMRPVAMRFAVSRKLRERMRWVLQAAQRARGAQGAKHIRAIRSVEAFEDVRDWVVLLSRLDDQPEPSWVHERSAIRPGSRTRG